MVCISSRSALRGSIASAVLAMGVSTSVQALDEVTLVTTWYAQAEHGGYYQAVAEGIYEEYGLDVNIRMGGPQVNGLQLLVAGRADFVMNYDFAVLSGVEEGLPLVTVAAPFQFDIQGLMTRTDVSGLDDLDDKQILVAGTGTTYWWPWFRDTYGYDEEQRRPYTFSLQPFFTSENVVQQAFPSSEPYQAQQQGMEVNFYLLSDAGYPPYTQAITTTRDMVENDPDLTQRFVEASIRGWKSYMENPEPGNRLIKEDNPDQTDGQLAFAHDWMTENEVVSGREAAEKGIGIMTDERWEYTANFMMEAGLLDSDSDWRKAYTTEFVDHLGIMP